MIQSVCMMAFFFFSIAVTQMKVCATKSKNWHPNTGYLWSVCEKLEYFSLYQIQSQKKKEIHSPHRIAEHNSILK